MTKDEANAHLIKARQVIFAWEGMGAPVGKPEDTLRIINEEVAILKQIIAGHPTKAETVGKLIERYLAMAATVKGAAH